VVDRRSAGFLHSSYILNVVGMGLMFWGAAGVTALMRPIRDDDGASLGDDGGYRHQYSCRGVDLTGVDPVAPAPRHSPRSATSDDMTA
jgi:hypothetical protein